MRILLRIVFIWILLSGYVGALWAQESGLFTPDARMILALQRYKVYVDPTLRGQIDEFALRKVAELEPLDRALRVVILPQVPSTGKTFPTRDTFARALHAYLALGKGKLIVVTGDGASVVTEALTPEQIAPVMEQTQSLIKRRPVEGIRETAARLDAIIAAHSPPVPPRHVPDIQAAGGDFVGSGFGLSRGRGRWRRFPALLLLLSLSFSMMITLPVITDS